MAVTGSYYGNVVALYTMDAFGNVLEMTNGADYNSERASDVQPYHLTTKEYDPDSRLYYFHARWYDPEVGRYLSLDPIPRINGYEFCGDNPARLTDPTGYQPEGPIWYWPPLDSDGDGFPDCCDPHPNDPYLPVNERFPYPGVECQKPYHPFLYTRPGVYIPLSGVNPEADDAILGIFGLSCAWVAAASESAVVVEICTGTAIITVPVAIIVHTDPIWLPSWFNFE